MFIEFTVGNYRSFKDPVTLSLEATKDDWLEDSRVFQAGGMRLLRSASVYGANASGKSNLIQAIRFFRDFVKVSSKETQVGEGIPVNPFRLQTGTENEPCHFEMVFMADGTRYRYGFEVDLKQVTSEWLFMQKDSIRETALFTREVSKIVCSRKFSEGKELAGKTRSNALFLSVCAQFNGAVSTCILQWIGGIGVISGIEDRQDMLLTADLLKDKKHREAIRHLLTLADMGITDVESMEIELKSYLDSQFPDKLPTELQSVVGALNTALVEVVKGVTQKVSRIQTYHGKFNAAHKLVGKVQFDILKDESAGTQKFVGLCGPFLETLQHGSVLVVDELEARLHPLLVRALMNLFHGPANTKNAQLIVATHDVGLLDSSITRRDQVWFAEKNRFGVSRLQSLAEYSIRKEAKFAKEYMLGSFGGIPKVRNLEVLPWEEK